MKKLLLPLLLAPVFAFGQEWEPVTTQNTCEKRHENAAALVGDSLYAIGGRGMKPLEALNLKTLMWKKLPTPPVEMNHFQAINYRDEVYVIAAFEGKYPHETPIPNMYIYSPKTGNWRKGPEIPKERLRGSAGVVVYKDKIYVVCGIMDGHYDGHVAWFDEYDPQTNTWKQLPDAPRVRDHISAAMVGDKLYLCGRTEIVGKDQSGTRNDHCRSGHVRFQNRSVDNVTGRIQYSDAAGGQYSRL